MESFYQSKESEKSICFFDLYVSRNREIREYKILFGYLKEIQNEKKRQKTGMRQGVFTCKSCLLKIPKIRRD